MTSQREAGILGENRAADWLCSRGWRIRERNFRSRRGEIDIIAERGADVVFVEVKAWSSLPPSELEYSIDSRKQGRIRQAARLYLLRNPEIADRRLRFDVIFLGRAGSEIRHIEGAFSGGND